MGPRMNTDKIRISSAFILALTSSNSAYDIKRLGSGRDCLRQRSVGRLVSDILATGKEPQQRPALSGHMVPNGPTQHRIASLQRIENRVSCHCTIDLELHISADSGK